MNIFDRLKQLKFIEPDASVAERSKRAILAILPPEMPLRRVTVRQVLIHLFEAGVAGGLVALFLFLITGGVANGPLAPAPFAAVNPQALHAEAQAVDIQIQLAKLAYQASPVTAESTAVGTTALSNALLQTKVATTTVETATSSGVSTPSLSVDDVLKALTK